MPRLSPSVRAAPPDTALRATPQSRVGMTSWNEHQYLQGDGSASSPARNGFCFRLMHLVLQVPRMPAKPRTSNELPTPCQANVSCWQHFSDVAARADDCSLG